MSLTKYLVSQLMLSNDERMDDLRVFFPNAKNEDWEVITAGQRVQVIKDTEDLKVTYNLVLKLLRQMMAH